VEFNTQYSRYIPEMIFGDLLTGSNFDDSQTNSVAGRNGLGRMSVSIALPSSYLV
jgi:DNA topoisomerase-2